MAEEGAEATAAVEVEAEVKDLGDKLAGLTLKQAVDLGSYMKEAYGIEPAAGGALDHRHRNDQAREEEFGPIGCRGPVIGDGVRFGIPAQHRIQRGAGNQGPAGDDRASLGCCIAA